MRAALLLGLGQLEVREVETPTPGPGEVVVQVEACSICGSDLRTFHYGHASVTFPAILGHEFAGVAAEVGKDVHTIVPGDRVTASATVPCGHCLECIAGRQHRCDDVLAIGEDLPGGFAEYVRLPARAVSCGSVVPLPAELPFEAATLAEPLSCVLNGQELAAVGLGDTVVVIGLGPIGCIHLIMARLRGARCIIGVEKETERIERAKSFQADLYINSQKEDAVGVVQEVTHGHGADVVIVACPSHKAQQDALAMAAKGGRVSLFGGLPKDDPMALLNTNLVHYREISVVGAFSASFSTLHKAVQLLSSEVVPTDLLITYRFPLEKVSEAFAVAMKPDSMRVVILP